MTTKVVTLYIKELHLSIAHWIPHHVKCGRLHGHTYFIQDLQVLVQGFVDLDLIEKEVKKLDHILIIPKSKSKEWSDLVKMVEQTKELWSLYKVVSDYYVIEDTDVPGSSVELIGAEIQKLLKNIAGVLDASFRITEGPNAGCEIPWSS